ncbi:MAG: hypothetical protein CFK52_01615 [Chloracidobacterium sp. CP2_5A]|nr:MAG: hypothetical protein CFK52_01615 [Chloracidobacterium sp. CP2_5A]
MNDGVTAPISRAQVCDGINDVFFPTYSSQMNAGGFKTRQAAVVLGCRAGARGARPKLDWFAKLQRLCLVSASESLSGRRFRAASYDEDRGMDAGGRAAD